MPTINKDAILQDYRSSSQGQAPDAQQRRNDPLRTSIDRATRINNPDQYEETTRLAGEQRLPRDTVERNLREVQRRGLLQQSNPDEIRESNPVLADFLSDPDNAATAVDDLENLRKLESSLTEDNFFMRRYNDLKRGGLQLLQGTDMSQADHQYGLQRLMQEVDQAVEDGSYTTDWLQTRLQDENVYRGFLPDLRRFADRSVEERQADIQQVQDGVMNELSSLASRSQAAADIPTSTARQRFNEAQNFAQAWSAFTASPVEVATSLTTESFAQFSPALPFLLAGPAAAAVGSGVTSAAVEYQSELLQSFQEVGIDLNDPESVREGLADEEKMRQWRKGATKRAVPIALVDALSAGIAGRLTAAARTPTGQAAAGAGEALVIQPAMGGIGEALGAVVAGEEIEGQAVLAEMLGEIAPGIAQTTAGVYHAREEAVRGRVQKEMADVMRSLGEQQRIDEVVSAAQESKLNQRAQVRFRKFLDAMPENNLIYMDPQVIRGLVEEGIQVPDELMGPVVEAETAGTDMSMSIGDFASQIATNEELLGRIRPHVKMRPESKTQQELQSGENNAIQNLVREAERARDIKTEADEIYEQVKDQIVATGRQSETTARFSALLIPAYVTVKAEQYNLSPREVYEMMGLRIEGPATEQRRAPRPDTDQIVDQPGMAEAVEFPDEQVKQTVRNMLEEGDITPEHAFRGASREELQAIAQTGELQIGQDFEGVPGISAVTVNDGQFPVYGEGVGYIVPPEVTTPSDRAGEVMVEGTIDPQALQYIVDGEVMDFEQMQAAVQEPAVLNQPSAVRLRRGQETLRKYGLNPDGNYTTRQIAEALEARQRERAGVIEKGDYSEAAERKIARWMTEEIRFEFEHPHESAVGWYGERFQNSLDSLSGLFPELADDTNARDIMTGLIAITSDGLKVGDNLNAAITAYEQYRSGTTVNLEGAGGRSAQNIQQNVENFLELNERFGIEETKRYLLQTETVSNLRKIAAERGVEFNTQYRADVKLPMSAVVLGPKLGAFYANLMGSHGYLTMDRWWSRTFNRYRGTLIPEPTRQGLERFKGLIGEPGIGDHEALMRTVEYRDKYAAKGWKDGTVIEKAANTLYKAAFENLNDTPFNASDRSFMIGVVERARKNLKRSGIDVTTADIQAILWYYEKRLYGELGARQTQDISYAEAADRVVQNRISGPDGRTQPEPGGNVIEGPDGSRFPTEETAEPSPKDGRAFRDFFAAVTEGATGRPSVSLAYEPIVPGVRTQVESGEGPIAEWHEEYLKHKGNFDDHIALSIPGYRDYQYAIGNAIVNTFDEGQMLDIGASEGTQAKTVTARSGGKIRTISLDPNPSMASTFAERSTVPGAEFSMTALGITPDDTGVAWTDEGQDISYFDDQGQKFQVVQESMVFQFISNNRGEQIARLAELTADDGIAIIQEKVFTDQWDANEQKKNREYKSKYFTAADLDAKSAEVLEGMNQNMIDHAQLEEIMRANFEFVEQIWDAGNFKGFVAAHDELSFNRFLNNMIDTSNPFDTRRPFLTEDGFQPAKDAAREYAERAGIPYEEPVHVPFDEGRAERIAQAYDAAEHRPGDPEVAAAYDAMIQETIEQFRVILDTGLHIEFIRGEDPYAKSPRLAIQDVADNNHLWVFSTRDGFGTDQSFDPSENPLLQETEFEIDGVKLLANDVFRIVHDYFGHVKNNNGFRAQGEEAAWRSHSTMYTPLARRAMTAETRGQNSWVNFGPHGARNRTAKAGETIFADQKTTLLPEWTSEVGRTPDNDGRTAGGELIQPPVQNGRITLQHFSRKERTVIDPAFYGNNFAGAERERSMRPDWVNRSYYGIESGQPGGYVIEPQAGHVKHEMSVDANQLYDLETDPDGLNPGDRTSYEKAIKDAGYIGYWAKSSDLGMTAAVFEPLFTEKVYNQWGYVIKDFTQQEEQAAILNQAARAEPQDGFYSALARFIRDAQVPGWKQDGTGSVKGETLWKQLQKAPLKKEELQWTGLEEFLTGNSDVTFTREQVQAFVEENGVNVETVVADEEAVTEDLEWEGEAWDDPEAWQSDLDLAIDDFEMGENMSIAGIDIEEWLTEWRDNQDPDDIDGLTDEEIRSDAADDFEKFAEQRVRETYFEDPLMVYETGQLGDDLQIVGSEDMGYRVVRGDFRGNGQTVRDDIYSLNEAEIQAQDYAREQGMIAGEDDPNVAQWDQYTTDFDGVRNTNYREIKLTLPDIPGEFIEENHFPDPNIVAFLRVTDADGLPVDKIGELTEEQANPPMTEEETEIRERLENEFTDEKFQEILEQEQQFIRDHVKKHEITITDQDKFEQHLRDYTAFEGVYRILGIEGRTNPVRAFSLERRDLTERANWLKVQRTNPAAIRSSLVPKTEKTFFIEEFQSDWHQQGRRHGYATDHDIAELSGVPDAPFKGDAWISLGLKQAIVNAVNNGHDSIAWADANVLGDRWSREYMDLYINQYDRKMPKLMKKLTGIEPKHIEPTTGETPVAGELGYWVIEITPELREKVQTEGLPLFQQERASIELLDNERIIRLSRSSDLSSFLHEAGHLFLEMEKAFAARFGVTDDQRKILEFVGAESLDEITANTPEGIEKHEKFARAFEAYLRTGEAPSLRLRDAFAAFARWLKRIYSSIRQLDVELTEDITGVFDRMLATQQEIEQARADESYQQLFRSAEQAGMTDEEWKNYQERVAKARNRAEGELDQKLFKELHKRRSQEWNEERKPLIEEAKERLSSEPVYQVMSDLEIEPMDYDRVIELYGKIPGKMIGKAKKGGVDPDDYASVYGFDSAQEMLRIIDETPTLNNAAIEEAQQQMIDKYGDLLDEATIEQEVREALHNEAQAELLVSELRALGKQTNRPVINREFLKAEARRVVSGMTFRKIVPGKYYRAEIKAAQEAATATDPDQKFAAKQKQLANHYLYKEAVEVKERMQKQRRYVRKAQTRQYDTKAVDEAYIQNIKILANMYDMKTQPDQVQAVRQILEWYDAQINDPNEFVRIELLDPHLVLALEARERRELPKLRLPAFDDLAASDLQGLYDMIRHLRHVGGKMSEAERTEFTAEKQNLRESIIDEGGRDSPQIADEPRRFESLYRTTQHLINKLPSLRNLIRTLDGFKDNGEAYRKIYQVVEGANNHKIRLQREVHERFNEELEDIHKIGLDRSRNSQVTQTKEDGSSWTLSSEARFMLALYWGTEGSREAIRDGHGVTDGDVQNMISTLTSEQLRLVNSVWKVNESIWPDLSSASVRIYGVAPPKLDPTPYMVNGVEMTGGHMRLMYDSQELELKTERDEGARMSTVMPTKAGSLHARVGSGGRPVLLDKNNIVRSINDSVHFIAFAEPGVRLQGMLNSREVQAAIERKHGKGFYRALLDNVEGIVSGRSHRESAPALAMVARHFRKTATFRYLTYSLRNVVQQFSALPIAAQEVGTGRLMAQYLRFMNPNGYREYRNFVDQRSEFMRDRASFVNREAAEYLRKVNVSGKAGYAWNQFVQYGFSMQTFVDAHIAYPTWMAKFDAEMEAHGDEARAVSAADTSIAESVGSGSDLHLGGAFHSNQSEFVRTMTVFGTWFNAYYNRVYRGTEGGQNFVSAEAFAALVTGPLMAATMASLAIMDFPDEEDDPEDWAAWAAARYGQFLAGTVPILRDIVGAFGGFSPQTPLGTGIETTARLPAKVQSWVEGEQASMETVSDMVKVTSVIVPMPGSSNFTRLMDYTASFEKGNESGDFNIYEGIVEGPDYND